MRTRARRLEPPDEEWVYPKKKDTVWVIQGNRRRKAIVLDTATPDGPFPDWWEDGSEYDCRVAIEGEPKPVLVKLGSLRTYDEEE